jgi:hypothetical protein
VIRIPEGSADQTIDQSAASSMDNVMGSVVSPVWPGTRRRSHLDDDVRTLHHPPPAVAPSDEMGRW